MARVFGDAGARVVLEEYLTGAEVSAFALTDGKTVLPLAMAQDYKRALDGDQGPNTGGMGAYIAASVRGRGARSGASTSEILGPTVAAMEDEGVRYQGVLYAGLMLTADGPKVLEFNAALRRPRDAGGLAAARVEPGRADAGLRGGQPRAVPGDVEARGTRRRRDGVGAATRGRTTTASRSTGWPRRPGDAGRRGLPFGNGAP